MAKPAVTTTRMLTLTPTNTLEYHSVRLGPLVAGKRVVRAGLEGDEKVVVNGLARVRPGMPVQPQEEVASGDGANFARR